MTRASNEQLEFDFESVVEPSEQELPAQSSQVPALVICFNAYLRSRRVREKEGQDAKLIERITSRVQHFK
ncbi:hypothetical protein [Acidovorax radicis]|uniref:hypothetical protein n=1 Tax=Acidovorax radicis TaxID=758826 RepID=UPI001CF7F2E6|nr:hypothetical protein [Acidovorax radicis]UCU99249.1 hypothetical protein KI609_00040 [Acidovorax radicis]